MNLTLKKLGFHPIKTRKISDGILIFVSSSNKLTKKWSRFNLNFETLAPYFLVVIFMNDLKVSHENALKNINTVKSRAVDRSTIQFWNFLAKGHST